MEIINLFLKPLIIFLLLSGLTLNSAWAKKCLYISSYHQGYEWSDEVEEGLRQELEGKCELKQFDMDTKRNKSLAFKQEAALKAKSLIESWKPDIVITSDDNAAKYLIKPFYKDHSLPFVFCGVNWTVDSYGFPYSNVTGMVEVAPIKSMFNKVSQILGETPTAYYLGADTLTEIKNSKRFSTEAKKSGIQLSIGLAKTTEEWIANYSEAQKFDFIIMGGKAGINDWNDDKILNHVDKVSRILSVTNHKWMMPYTIIGFTKIPQEQGKWAAQAAIAILDGIKPIDIPIVANRKWDYWLNQKLLNVSKIPIKLSLIKKAKKIN